MSVKEPVQDNFPVMVGCGLAGVTALGEVLVPVFSHVYGEQVSS